MANGFGVYIKATGARCEGYWKDDRLHGKCTEAYPDNSKFEGNYENGVKQGAGKYTYTDGS